MTHAEATLPMTKGSLMAIFLLGICALVNMYSPQPILVQLAQWGHITPESASLTISASTLGVAITAPLAGSISDHLGRKNLILTAIGAMLLCNLLCALSGNFYQLLVWRFLQGLTIPFIFAVTLAYIAEEVSDNARAITNSLYVAGTAFGGFLGRFVSGLSTHVSSNWHSSFYLLSIVQLIILVIVLCELEPERYFKPSPSLTKGLMGTRKHLMDKRLILSFIIGSFLLFQQVASFTYISIALLAPPYNLSTDMVGLIFLVFLLPVVTTPIAGRFIRSNSPLAAYLCFALMGAAGLLMTLINDIWSILVGLAFSCVSVFAGQACATYFISTYCKTNKSSAIGLYLTSYYLGGAVGGIVPALVYAHAGWPGCVCLLLIIIFASILCVRSAWTGGS